MVRNPPRRRRRSRTRTVLASGGAVRLARPVAPPVQDGGRASRTSTRRARRPWRSVNSPCEKVPKMTSLGFAPTAAKSWTEPLVVSTCAPSGTTPPGVSGDGGRGARGADEDLSRDLAGGRIDALHRRRDRDGALRAGELRRERDVPAVAHHLADRARCVRILAQHVGPVRAVAVVVDQHLHARVMARPREQAVHERRGVGAPERPLSEHHRLRGELAIELLEVTVIGELRVEVGADPVDVLRAGPVGARAVGGRLGVARRLRHPEERDRDDRQLVASRPPADGRQAEAAQLRVDPRDRAAAHDQHGPLPRPPEHRGRVARPARAPIGGVRAIRIPVAVHLRHEPDIRRPELIDLGVEAQQVGVPVAMRYRARGDDLLMQRAGGDREHRSRAHGLRAFERPSGAPTPLHELLPHGSVLAGGAGPPLARVRAPETGVHLARRRCKLLGDGGCRRATDGQRHGDCQQRKAKLDDRRAC